MPFQLPNYADAAFPAQASPDAGDFAIMAAGTGQTGVVTGCAGSVTGANMVVTIAAGRITVNGTEVAVASGDLTIGTANATNPRIDLLVVSSAGTKSVQAGTAAANPVYPAIPSNSVVLYAVYVPANDTSIQSNQLVDKRVFVVNVEDAMAYLYF